MSLRIAGDRNKFAQRLFADLPARYDRLAEWLSFGQNASWRRAMVDRIVPELAQARARRRLRDRRRRAPARRPHERTRRGRRSHAGACCGSASATWLRPTRPGASSS